MKTGWCASCLNRMPRNCIICKRNAFGVVDRKGIKALSKVLGKPAKIGDYYRGR